jgi:protein PhnA
MNYTFIMNALPPCPKCTSAYAYQDRGLLNCPECGHEWSPAAAQENAAVTTTQKIIRDANGVELKDGDTVAVIKDLKLRGSSAVVKVGTKVKGIRLVEGDHDIDCKIAGIGPMQLKSEFVKKVTD